MLERTNMINRQTEDMNSTVCHRERSLWMWSRHQEVLGLDLQIKQTNWLFVGGTRGTSDPRNANVNRRNLEAILVHYNTIEVSRQRDQGGEKSLYREVGSDSTLVVHHIKKVTDPCC